MRFLVMSLLLMAAASSTDDADSQGSPPPSQPPANTQDQQGGAEKATAQGKINSKGEEDDSYVTMPDDEDWDKRKLNTVVRDPNCKGGISEDHELAYDNLVVLEGARSVSQLVVCTQQVDIMSEKGSFLAMYEMNYRKSCSKGICYAGHSGAKDKITDSHKKKTSHLVTPDKSAIFRQKANELLGPLEEKLEAHANLVLSKILLKHREVLKEMAVKYFQEDQRQLKEAKQAQKDKKEAKAKTAKEPSQEADKSGAEAKETSKEA